MSNFRHTGAGTSDATRATALPASDVSSLCDGVATMLGAGIQLDEALALLAESSEGELSRVAGRLYRSVADGSPLRDAMLATGAFPDYATELVGVGERFGRVERVLRSLSSYYDEEDRVIAKIRSTVAYPAALLCVMSVVLAFTVAVILPVFFDVYESMTGSLTSGSSLAVSASVVIGWVALALTLAFAVAALALVAAGRTVRGQAAIVRLMERAPLTRDAMYQLALSRFSAVLSTCVAAGSNVDAAMGDSVATVDHPLLRERLERAYASMLDVEQGRGLAQAIAENDVLEPAYARMLAVGARVGSIDEVLERLSATFFDDAVERIDLVIDGTEPALAALVTTAVGATLIAVMLPLVGIMGSVG